VPRFNLSTADVLYKKLSRNTYHTRYKLNWILIIIRCANVGTDLQQTLKLLRTVSDNIDLRIFLVISQAQKLPQNLGKKLRKSYERFSPLSYEYLNDTRFSDNRFCVWPAGIAFVREVMHIDF